LKPQLKKIVNKIRNESLRNEVTELLENPVMEIGGRLHTGMPLETSPAGIHRHHSYPEGLVEHVVASCEIALNLCDVVEKVYHGKVDVDLVLAGMLLHDVFKTLTYKEENGAYRATLLAERLDHLTLIVSEMVRRGFPLDLIHIVCAHHGGQAGPIWPKTVEALICHLADVTDSRLNGEVLRAARYLSRQASGEELQITKAKEAFEIVHAKAVEGWSGVQKTIKKIKRKRLDAS